MMEELRPLPMMKSHGYNRVSAGEVQSWHPIQGSNCHTASVSSNPIRCMNPPYVYRAPAYMARTESKSVCRSFNEIKQQVTAFGPKHAEHAKRLYQLDGKTPECRRVLAPPSRPSFGPMQVSNFNQSGVTDGCYLPRDLSFTSAANRATSCTDLARGQVAVPITSRPYETVLKVAKISPRPDKMQPKKLTTSFSFGGKAPSNKVDEGLIKKSVQFQKSGLEMDLENAPVFQILCEISRT